MKSSDVRELLESLSGQPPPAVDLPSEIAIFAEGGSGLGYSQLNELLLLFGLDRITHSFFQFLVDGTATYCRGSAFKTAEELKSGIDRFRILAVLLYGNIKYAFKSWSRDSSVLLADLEGTSAISVDEFATRHMPILPISEIAPEDAFLTGYIVENQLRDRLASNPDDAEALRLQKHRDATIAKSLENQRAYLTSDHLDVYVATSMREKHEFVATKSLVTSIFAHPMLEPLKLRWFDPTQAYCADRIDKGLSEALMLRRATCTIYLAQESDTLGKDSELASTLAQGKPVVVFIPKVDDTFLERQLQTLSDLEQGKSKSAVMLGQLSVFEPIAAWTDSEVRSWCNSPDEAPTDKLRSRLAAKMAARYDGRAKTLQSVHPLGIQVNLATGVATGVLVVRTVEKCAALVRNILTQRLQFDLEESKSHILLRERISECVFRVVTKDDMLTNTFWNFYRDPVE
jgi:hypothetical protein